MNRFNRGCEFLTELDVSDLIAWISESSDTIRTWVKQSDRPYVMVDPLFLQSKTDRVVGELMKFFPGGSDKYRSISVLHPGDYVPPHTDICVPEWRARVHVPIITNDKCFFWAKGVKHHLKVGRAYRVNPGRSHAVENSGCCTRVHLMFDVFE